MGSRKCLYPERHPVSIDSSEASRSASPCPPAAIRIPQVPDPVAPTDEDTAVNMLHMELMHHFTVETFVPEMGEDLIDTARLVIEAGLHAPYLMYETLAISARRLACLRASERGKYLRHAMQLQTKAISLFNNDKKRLDESSCVARMLFSSLLGRHLLSDALASRDGELDAFLDNFVRYTRLHRSIKGLSAEGWPFLAESKLKDAMAWGRAIFDIQPRGRHCDEVLQLISISSLDEESQEACRKAVHFLQIGFDDAEGQPGPGRTIHVIFWWAILMPEEFVELLASKRPEALVVFGYYAALLQKGRRVWLIGDASSHVHDSVARYLGDEWLGWLAAPRALLANL